MKLLVMRHGAASFGAVNDAMRPLTKTGRNETLAMAEACNDSLSEVTTICCSPLTRARQTAALVKPFTDKDAHLIIDHSLTPESSPESVADFLQTMDDSSVLLVTHMPLVSELVAWLTDRFPGPSFTTSGLACLDLVAASRGSGDLQWHHNPQSQSQSVRTNTQPRMNFHQVEFTVNGLTLKGKAWGNPEHSPVLALHGWLDNCASFDVLAPKLSDTYLVALDLAGHGLSSDRSQDSNYNIWTDVGELIAIADLLGWERFALLGHSRGAMIAILLAGTFPDRTLALGLIDGIVPEPVSSAGAPNQLARAILDHQKNCLRKPRYYPDRTAALEVRTSGKLPLSDKQAGILAARGLIETDDGWLWRADPRLRGVSEFKLNMEHIEGFLGSISCPVQLTVTSKGVAGRQPELLQQVALALPQLELLVLDGGHHLHMDDQADAIAAALNRIYSQH